MSKPETAIARHLRTQGQWCERLGSTLYATLLSQAAEDVALQGACYAVLHDHHNDPPGSALGLRFMGAVHRLVLEGKAPRLAACYPAAGGNIDCPDLWPRFRDTVQHHTAELRALVCRPVQTNAVGRCAALLGGFLEIARRTWLPLRLLEVGAAAGLLLRWDRYRYQIGAETWGDADSPVRIVSAFDGERPPLDVVPHIVERAGCDASPIDPGTEEGRLTLQSYLWPDQLDRFRQLASALEIANRVPAQIDKCHAPDWIETALANNVRSVTTVVYHSIVWQYLAGADQSHFAAIMAAAGEAATPDQPLAWLRFEPAHDTVEVRLQLWPGGEDRLLARAGFHGPPVHWLPA